MLKEDFITLMERRHPWASRDQIEQLFNECKALDVASVFKKLEQKYTQNDLTKDFQDKLMFTTPEPERPLNLLERRPRGMQPRRQIAQVEEPGLKRSHPESYTYLKRNEEYQDEIGALVAKRMNKGARYTQDYRGSIYSVGDSERAMSQT